MSGRELTRISVDAPIRAVAFSADAGLVTAVSDDELLRTWIWRDQDVLNVRQASEPERLPRR
jgi:hypothetical protein